MKRILFTLFVSIIITNYSLGQKTIPSTTTALPLVYQNFKIALEAKINTLKTAKSIDGGVITEPFDGDEGNAEIFISPLIQQSLDVLHYETFTDNDIIDEYGSLNSPKIIQAATTLLGIKSQEIQALEAQDFKIDSNSMSDTILDCIKEASGLAELTLIATAGFNVWLKQMGKKAALRALVRFGAKYFGYIGAVIFAYDVVECIATGN